MKTYLDLGEYFHEFENNDEFSVYGGEIDTDDLNVDEYGIQINDVTIGKIPSSQYSKLAVSMINHLILNGHNYCFVETSDGVELRKL